MIKDTIWHETQLAAGKLKLLEYNPDLMKVTPPPTHMLSLSLSLLL